MGWFSVRPFVRPFPPLGHPAMPEAQPASPEAQPAKPEAWGLAGWLAGWASGMAGWPRGGNGRTKGRTENLPIIQDYRGRCPASSHKRQEESRAGKENRWPFEILNSFSMISMPFPIEFCEKKNVGWTDQWTDGRTDRQTDRPTHGWTDPHIEMRGCIWNPFNYHHWGKKLF